MSNPLSRSCGSAATLRARAWFTLSRLEYLRQCVACSPSRSSPKRAGVNKNTITRIEHGRPAPRPATIKKLAAALKVEPDDLMGPRRRSSPPVSSVRLRPD